MSRILLTGATGYLGSHLAHAFLRKGYEVAILKRTTSEMRRIAEISDQLEVFDINVDGVSRPFEEMGPFDVVVHTATCYGRDGVSISEVVQSNVCFPVELLEAAANSGTELFINSDSYFCKSETCSYLDRYVLSKKQFKSWGERLSKQRGFSFITLSLEHLYGPGDSKEKFVAQILDACVRDLPEIRLTKGEQRRDFLYVDDAVSAYLAVIKNYFPSLGVVTTFEVGSGFSTSIREFVEKVRNLAGSNVNLNFGVLPYRTGEIMDSKAQNQSLVDIGWTPVFDLNGGVEKMVEVAKGNHAL